MRGLLGIVLNTFRETVRQAFYLLLLIAGMAAVLITLRLPLFTLEEDTDLYKELGLSFTLLFLLLVGLLAAATGVAREVEDKTAQTILAKALGRAQFILGKFLGVMAAVALGLAVLGTVFVAAVYYRVRLDAGVLEVPYTHGGVGRQVEAFQARQLSQALTVVPGLVLILLQVGVLSAVATALSARLSAAASVGLGLAAYLVGHLMVFLESASRLAGTFWQGAAKAALAALPFLEIFNLNQKLAHAVLTPQAAGSPGAAAWAEVWAYVGWAALYALAYGAFAILLAIALFRRRSIS
jgi:ABC-type transport system involved in multi-copper enzyme maturation permease subunit